MEVMYKAKDLATIRNQNVEDKFVDILRGIKLGGAGLVRETTSESDVYLVSGDLRLLSRRNTDPREIILAKHSGSGPRGGSYKEANSGQPSEVSDIDELIADFS
jgi:hypothetical protein